MINPRYFVRLAVYFLIAMIAVFGMNPPVFALKPDEAQKLLEQAVQRFVKVSEGIYRSGIFYEEAAPLLKDLGIKTVISFDDDPDRAKREEQFLKLFGIYQVWIPWNAHNMPKDEAIEKTLLLMKTPETRPILIHGEQGVNRTGVAIACWRVREKKWSAAQAYEEMKANGFESVWFGHLKKYLYQFARKNGEQTPSYGNVFERTGVNVLYFFYRFRKLGFS